MKEVIIYTDGACLGNPGPGGYGVVLKYGEHRKELSEGFRMTTNNRMEILAAIVALKAIKSNEKVKIILHSDSQLLIKAVNEGWLSKWQKKNWKTKGNENRLNYDLWIKLHEELPKHLVEFRWVKGHVGIPENERCDVLSKEAASKSNLKIDKEYEKMKMEKSINEILVK
ncbi:MAG: ribonuclease HI [FCB group bacterium]|jgi:ribonuclease HI